MMKTSQYVPPGFTPGSAFPPPGRRFCKVSIHDTAPFVNKDWQHHAGLTPPREGAALRLLKAIT